MLRALLLQVFFSVRSERQLVEQIDYNLLFRSFVGLGMDDAVWNHAVFSKSRDRLLNAEVAQRFFAEVNRRAKRFMSDDHFTVDGTLIQAWASQKSFSPKDGSGDGDGTNFHGQKRSNERTRRMNRPPIRTRDCTRRAMARNRIWPILATRWWGQQRSDRRCDGDRGRRLCRARSGSAAA